MATVCVTGANSFVGYHIILLLIERNYKVRGTVRKIGDIKNGYLKKLAAETGKLELFEADLMKEGSFDEAIKGCQSVIHTASPAVERSLNPVEEIVKPALDGTLNVLNACKKSNSVKVVVITSSVAACVPYFIENVDKNKIYSEEDWNTDTTETEGSYNYAKASAEGLAWNFVKYLSPSEKFRLVSICPGMIFGKQPSKDALNTSNSVCFSLVNGNYPMVPNIGVPLVHARDVAEAHVNAIERESANGRYILVGESMPLLDFARQLAGKYPQLPVPTRQMPDWIMYMSPLFDSRITSVWVKNSLGVHHRFNNERARKDLGIKFRSGLDAASEAVDSFLALGMLKPKSNMSTILWTAGIIAIGAILYMYTQDRLHY